MTEEKSNPIKKLVNEKEKIVEQLNIAANDYVTLKNRYTVKSNEIRLKPDKIKEDMGLSKAPTEKQQQAYIDTQLKEDFQNMKIAEENKNAWKRKLDLIDTKISAEMLMLQVFVGMTK